MEERSKQVGVLGLVLGGPYESCNTTRSVIPSPFELAQLRGMEERSKQVGALGLALGEGSQRSSKTISLLPSLSLF